MYYDAYLSWCLQINAASHCQRSYGSSRPVDKGSRGSHPRQPKVEQTCTNHHNQSELPQILYAGAPEGGSATGRSSQVLRTARLFGPYCSILPSVEPASHLSPDKSPERIQRQTLRMILPDLNYKEALETTGFATLQQRREQICLSLG